MLLTVSGTYSKEYEYDRYDGATSHYNIGGGDRDYEVELDIYDKYVADFFTEDLSAKEILEMYEKEIKEIYHKKGELPPPEDADDYGEQFKDFLLKDDNLIDFVNLLDDKDIEEEIVEYLRYKDIITDSDIADAIYEEE